MKNKIFKVLILFLFPVLMGAGCEKDYEEPAEGFFVLAESYKFSDFVGDDFAWDIKSDYNNDYYIINSQEELRKYTSTDSIPEIDFSEYIIILGSKGFTHGTSLINEMVEENKEELIYTLTFSKSDTMAAPAIKYHIVIPLPYNKDIKVVELLSDSMINKSIL